MEQLNQLKELFKNYEELIAKTINISRNIVADEEAILQSEFQTERTALFDKHLLPAKDGGTETRLAKNDDERKVIKRGIQLTSEHADKRMNLNVDKLMYDQTQMQLRLLERKIAFAMATVN